MRNELRLALAWIRTRIQGAITIGKIVTVGLALTIAAVGGVLLPLLAVFGILALISFLMFVMILRLANLGKIFTTEPEQATTAFVVAGKTLVDIWPNIDGHKMSDVPDLEGYRWVVPARDDEDRLKSFFRTSRQRTVPLQRWLWREFGIRYVSIWIGQKKIHPFDISRKIILDKSKVAQDAPLRARVVESKNSPTVRNLLHLIPRPIVLEGLELAGDNSRVNLLIFAVFRQIIPALPVFYYQGEFFPILDAAIEAAMVDFCASHRVAVYRNGEKAGQFAHHTYELPKDNRGKRRDKYEESFAPAPLTYEFWLLIPKASKPGEISPIEKALRGLNISRSYFEELEAAAKTERAADGSSPKDELVAYARELARGEFAEPTSGSKTEERLPSGLVPRIGLALVSLRIQETEAHKTTEELAAALLAKEIERHKAKGVREKAAGARDAELMQVEAEKRQFGDLTGALKSHGVHANVAARVVETYLRTGNIAGRDSSITTYVEGGASSSVMVPAAPPAPNQTKGTSK